MNENTPDYQSFKQLNSSGNWAYFIGFYYLAIGLFVLASGIFVFLNIDNKPMLDYFDVSENIQYFLSDMNKYTVLVFCLIASSIVFLNAFFLFKFRGNAMSFFLKEDDPSLIKTYDFLKYYFILNSCFSIGSLLVSIVALVYYMFV